MKLSTIADHFELELRGNGDVEIHGMSSPREAGATDLVFVEKASYLQAARESRAGAFLIDQNLSPPDSRPCLLAARPRVSFVEILGRFEKPPKRQAGVASSAIIGEGCRIDPSATVMDSVVMGERVTVEPDAVIYPFCYLGDDVHVGSGSVLFPHAVVLDGCRIGSACRVLPGAVVGSDGFGYHDEAGQRYRVPHLGRAVVADNVDIGANSTIDRGVLGTTSVGAQTKIDNLVQVGHNCTIGPFCYLVAQSGVSGSSVLEKGATLAGQSGVSDHVTVGSGAIVIGKSAVRQSVPAGQVVGGIPARDIRTEMAIIEALPRLPTLFEELDRSKPQRSRAGLEDWKDRVRLILAETLRVPLEDIELDTNLMERFDADSLTVLTVLTELEGEFDISIPDQDARLLRTLGEIVDYLEARVT